MLKTFLILKIKKSSSSIAKILLNLNKILNLAKFLDLTKNIVLLLSFSSLIVLLFFLISYFI